VYAVTRKRSFAGLAAFLAAATLIAQSHSSTAQRSLGIVVEAVGMDTADLRAGVRPGDLLTSWSLQEAGSRFKTASGQLKSPFDLIAISVAQAPRGHVTVSAIREGHPLSFDLSPDDWEWVLTARPRFSGKNLDQYIEGRTAFDHHDLDSGAGLWKELASKVSKKGDHDTASWLFLKSADLFSEAQRRSEAIAAIDRAIEESERLSSAAIRSHLVYRKGLIVYKFSDYAEARAQFVRAIQIQRRGHADQLQLAETLAEAAIASMQLDDLTVAESYAEEALRIRKTLAPNSVSVASSFVTLSSIADSRGDHAKDEEYCRLALSIMQRLVPGSLTEAHTLVNLSVNNAMRGDLAAAEDLQRQALEIRKRLAPMEVPGGLENLGSIALDRGDLASAEAYFLRGLALAEEMRRMNKAVKILQDLSGVAKQRGDFASAANYLKRALEAEEVRAPEGPDVAQILTALGSVARDQGRADLAQDYFTRALRLRRKLSPQGPQTAVVLASLSSAYRDRGDADTAGALAREALGIRERVNPDGLLVADSLRDLARLAEDQGDFGEAERLYGRALTIRKRVASTTRETALALGSMGELHRRAGRLQESAARQSTSWISRTGGLVTRRRREPPCLRITPPAIALTLRLSCRSTIVRRRTRRLNGHEPIVSCR